MAHGAAVCTSATLEALQRLRTDAPASHQESLQRLRAWALAMHVRSALLPLQREIQARQRTAVCLVDGEPIPLRASFAARSYWIPGSYAPALSEKCNSFLRLLKLTVRLFLLGFYEFISCCIFFR